MYFVCTTLFAVLTAYRRHRSSCKHRSRRVKGCFCPIWVQGILDGKRVRRSLDLTSWEAAQRRIRDLEIHGEKNLISVEDACERWIADCEARGLQESTLSKYRARKVELSKVFGKLSVRSVSIEDLRHLREGWKVKASSTGKRLEIIRNFFAFCIASEWIAQSPARGIKPPKVRQSPTLPFSAEEWEKILWALDAYEELHPNRIRRTALQLKAIVLLMRYSGIRISDVVALKRDKVAKGRLFLYQAKTGQPVQIPLPKIVLNALKDCDEGQPFYFWSGVSRVKTAITEWQERIKKVFEIAGVGTPGARFQSHRLRDTFSVELLNRGVPLQTVSMLLGHSSVRTTERHYSPWVKSRQDALEEAIRKTWA